MHLINREIENLRVDFEILEDVSKVSVGCNKASGYLVFDVRMTFKRIYLLVKDGYEALNPSSLPLVALFRERALVLH